MRFSTEVGVRPMIETFPLAEANAGFDKMMNSTVNFRAVVTMDWVRTALDAIARCMDPISYTVAVVRARPRAF